VTKPDGSEVLLKAKNILIATGGAPTRLPIEGAELAVTSDEALSLDNLPDKSVLIVGSGCVERGSRLGWLLQVQCHRAEQADATQLAPTDAPALPLPCLLPLRCNCNCCSYIAVEFAGIFQGLGAQVHLMYRADKPLRG
jgi:hypothetical protein